MISVDCAWNTCVSNKSRSWQLSYIIILEWDKRKYFTKAYVTLSTGHEYMGNLYFSTIIHVCGLAVTGARPSACTV